MPGEVLSDHDITGDIHGISGGQVLPWDFGTPNGGEPSVQFSPEGV